jgi:putative component of membrane protein insertase Oxa1/YidC/SpoIIIJ protein YidD
MTRDFHTSFDTTILALIVSFLFIANPLQAQDASHFDSSDSFLHYPATYGLKFFRWGISPIDGHRCPMQPSCSHFASGSIARFGFLRGSLMTFDRLHRCGHDLAFYSSISEQYRMKWDDNPEHYWKDEAYENGNPCDPSTDFTEEKTTDFVAFLDEFADSEILLLEYYRLVYGHVSGSKQHPNFETCVKTVAKILAHDTSRPEASLKWYLQSGDWALSDSTRSKLKLYASLGLLRSDRWREGSIVLGAMVYPDLNLEDKKLWRSVRALTWIHMSEWGKASFEYNALDELGLDTSHLSQLALSGSRIPQKSPRAAGLLGIIPGLGYAYSSHYKTAVAAMIVIGLTTAATIEAHNQGNEGLAVSVGLLSIGWYSGSIFGSVESAKRYNKHQREVFFTHFPDSQFH